MDEKERLLIIQELRVTDFSFLSIDKDRTVSLTIEKIFIKLGNEYELFFANGGDQNNKSVPEQFICNKLEN
jgi:D-beta-D-heptose 7-phosphate kinase/D-beta-D-heptose 1-phosphate adenosyltransferase